MIRTIVLLVLWFGFLIKGADLLVDGSSNIAKRFWISEIIIGLTIVAFGTSAPELVVNITSSLQGTTDLAIGNILGSNIANILLIVWIASIVRPLNIHHNTRLIEIPFMVLSIVAFWLLASSPFEWENNYLLNRSYAAVLLLLFGAFLYYLFRTNNDPTKREIKEATQTLRKSILYTLLWLAGLMIGWQWIVDGAVTIASHYGIPERIIGLTVVAIGTSLPELVTSIVAGLKGKSDIAIGNIVWSNIFNVLFVLGISWLITPIPFSHDSTIDLYVTVSASLLLLLVTHMGEKQYIKRHHGILFTVCYLVYILYLIIQ